MTWLSLLQMWTYHTFKQWPATVFSISLASAYRKLAISIWNDWSCRVFSLLYDERCYKHFCCTSIWNLLVCRASSNMLLILNRASWKPCEMCVQQKLKRFHLCENYHIWNVFCPLFIFLTSLYTLNSIFPLMYFKLSGVFFCVSFCPSLIIVCIFIL